MGSLAGRVVRLLAPVLIWANRRGGCARGNRSARSDYGHGHRREQFRGSASGR